MPNDNTDQVIDSPRDWVAEHIARYVASSGDDGFEWRGVHTLLLSTKGRRSGAWRRTALIFGEDGDNYVIVASKGGAPDHPLWYENLAVDPHVRVQVKGDEFAAHANVATGPERARLWQKMCEVWPDYADYQTRTTREIPVIVLSRA